MTPKLHDVIHRWHFQIYDPFESSIYDIVVAGKGKIAGTGEGEVTGVGGDATPVVTEVIIASVNDVTVTGVISLIYDGNVGDPGTGTLGLLLCDVTPPLFDGVADVTFIGVFVGLNAGVFVKISDG